MGEGIAQIVVGVIELLFGRKLFWLFVALGGFLFGWLITPAIHDGTPVWARVVIGVILGIILAILARWFTRAMVALGGFLIFGPGLVLVVERFGGSVAQGSRDYWIVFVIGGVVGALVLGVFFNWALIILTSLVGAASTVAGIEYFTDRLPHWAAVIMTIVLLVVGLAYQISNYRRRKRRLLRTR